MRSSVNRPTVTSAVKSELTADVMVGLPTLLCLLLVTMDSADIPPGKQRSATMVKMSKQSSVSRLTITSAVKLVLATASRICRTYQ